MADGSGFFKRIRSDFEYRTYFNSTVSFFASIVFAGYNIFLGAVYETVWNIGIAAYYVLLVGVRAFVGFKEIRLRKSELPDAEKEEIRKNIFIVQSVLLFVIDLALTGPITIMVMKAKALIIPKFPQSPLRLIPFLKSLQRQ
jgi:hypothetical protein